MRYAVLAPVIVGGVGMARLSAQSTAEQDKDRQRLFTDTFIRRDGRRQCVASQGTVVAAQQK